VLVFSSAIEAQFSLVSGSERGGEMLESRSSRKGRRGRREEPRYILTVPYDGRST
jgi:hypothetical protein